MTAWIDLSLFFQVSMIGFLGWLAILHFGPNASVYPFFRFSTTSPELDESTFKLTFLASLAVWVSLAPACFDFRN